MLSLYSTASALILPPPSTFATVQVGQQPAVVQSMSSAVGTPDVLRLQALELTRESTLPLNHQRSRPELGSV